MKFLVFVIMFVTLVACEKKVKNYRLVTTDSLTTIINNGKPQSKDIIAPQKLTEISTGFINPIWIDTDSLGNIFILDDSLKSIIRYNRGGNYLGNFTLDSLKSAPISFCISGKNALVLTSDKLHKYSLAGELLATGPMTESLYKIRSLGKSRIAGLTTKNNQRNQIKLFDHKTNTLMTIKDSIFVPFFVASDTLIFASYDGKYPIHVYNRALKKSYIIDKEQDLYAKTGKIIDLSIDTQNALWVETGCFQDTTVFDLIRDGVLHSIVKLPFKSPNDGKKRFFIKGFRLFYINDQGVKPKIESFMIYGNTMIMDF